MSAVEITETGNGTRWQSLSYTDSFFVDFKLIVVYNFLRPTTVKDEQERDRES